MLSPSFVTPNLGHVFWEPNSVMEFHIVAMEWTKRIVSSIKGSIFFRTVFVVSAPFINSVVRLVMNGLT